MIELLLVLVVALTFVWVLYDATNLGMRRGQLDGGLLDMGPLAWAVCCLLLWVVALPLYLRTRSQYSNQQYLLPQVQPTTMPQAPGRSTASELEQLARLKQEGTLTEAEFLILKRRAIYSGQ